MTRREKAGLVTALAALHVEAAAGWEPSYPVLDLVFIIVGAIGLIGGIALLLFGDRDDPDVLDHGWHRKEKG